jgi:hypothetical protein
VVGQPVTYTATVQATGASKGVPTGEVTFTDNGTAVACNGASSPGPVPTNQSGVAVCSVVYHKPGTHCVTATFAGTVDYLPSTSKNITVRVGDEDEAAVTSSAAPGKVGATVTYTATVVAAPGSAIPAGNVVFLDDGKPISGCPVTGVALNSAGVATCSHIYGQSGTHQIVARFEGSALFMASASMALEQVIGP